MKPINAGGHPAYQDRVLNQLRKYYPNAVNSLSSSTWQILKKFGNLDLSAIDILMHDRYSAFGPEPRLPSDMLRSILVSVEFKITSYTRFASDLKKYHLHSIISGFNVGDTPGIGTFYDFHKRHWLSDNNNLSDSIHPPKHKPLKPKGKDLISLKKLSLAGDGTPVYTAAQERKKHTCNCLEKSIRDCRCNRIYRQPDCDIGWDSYRSHDYFGYDLYMLTASDSKQDLPVFPSLSPASSHDSHGFLYNWFSMKQMLPPRLFNNPPRGSEEWKREYNARTSAERCNKREKIDYKSEDGRYRSSKMWYCRLFSIMMCQIPL